METPCKNCCFATYEGKTQTGCVLHRLEVLRNHGVEVVEVYDEEKEFYLIKGNCNYARREKWKERVLEAKLDPIARVKSECDFDINWFVYVNKENIDEAHKKLEQINKWKIYPDRVIMVYHDEGIPRMPIYSGFKWEFQRIVERDENGTLVDKDRAIRIATKSCKSLFFGWSEGDLPDNPIEKMRSLINDQAQSVILAKFPEGFICYRPLANQLGYRIVDNIEAMVADTQEFHLIKEL